MSTAVLYGCRGVIEVNARGYWFSAGGIKGSFGYYPHLKDEQGLPVYPDTQIKGDMRMAAEWLAGLDARFAGKVAAIFGKGDDAPGLIKFQDLRLVSRDAQPDNPAPLFQVKHRVSINDTTKTVEPKFLAAREYAFLDGRTLRAKFELGYFTTLEELKLARELVEECCYLLSGFGAGRTRGNGRGTLRMTDVVRHDAPAAEYDRELTPQLYTLTAFNHFRNRMIEPGGAQVLEAENVIREDMLRSWIAVTYKRLWGDWPTPSQMAELGVEPLYPCGQAKVVVPAPCSINDSCGTLVDTWKPDVLPEDWNIFNHKQLKPIAYVTRNAAPRSVAFPEQMRFRNKLGTHFAPNENSLFLQRFLPAGTRFSGRITFAASTAFTRRVRHILAHAHPLFNGSVFTPELEPWAIKTAQASPQLVTIPVPVGAEDLRAVLGKESRLKIATQERYATMLKRPRRQRIVVCPGSMLKTPPADAVWSGKTVSWSGLAGNTTVAPITAAKSGANRQDGPSPRQAATLDGTVQAEWELTPSQTSFFRDLANPDLPAAQCEAIMQERRASLLGRKNAEENKHAEKVTSCVLPILDHALQLGHAQRQQWLLAVYDEFAVRRWRKKHSKTLQQTGGAQ